ncbi:uncharacterized protein [Onthophagus taurus]|uniref:uncharacterized protein n=1 Tax=Onthophagus taurus TaxID=166361 RepID=UPI0039BDE679
MADQLVRKRAVLKASLTRFANFIASTDETRATELEIRLENHLKVLSEYEIIQDQIEELKVDEPNNERERVEFEHAYYKNVSKAKEILQKTVQLSANTSTSTFNNNFASNLDTNNVRLPTINLPEFNGNYEDWYKFKDSFNALVHENNKLSEVQKFIYLVSSLKDAAAEVVQSLEVSSENYPVALELLNERFENKKIIVNSHVRGIFELENVIKDAPKSLRQFLDGFLKHFRALKALKLPVEHWDVPMVYLLTKKLDNNTRRLWEQSVSQDIPNLNEFTDFIKNRCQILETIAQSNKTLDKDYSKPYKQRAITNVTATKISCVQCKASHSIFQCEIFLKRAIIDRIRLAKDLKLCTNCLNLNHTVQQCKSKRNCFKCSKRHHTLLHLENENSEAPRTAVTSHAVNRGTYVILSTATVYIKNGNELVEARALIDNGSDTNYVTKAFTRKLNVTETTIDPITIASVNGVTSQVSKQTNLTIQAKYTSYQVNLQFLILNRITEKIPTIKLNEQDLKIPKGVKLADRNWHTPGDIDLLIGAEIFYELLLNGKITLGRNSPVLRETRFGWLITGRLHLDRETMNTCHLSVSNPVDLHNQLQRFWSLDECPSERVLSLEEEQCEQKFVESTTRDENGRYTVRLPFNEKMEQLGNNLAETLNRFQGLEKRLGRNAILKEEYKRFMGEYERLGHMSRITDLNSDNLEELKGENSYYIPHHPVFKTSSSTTKLRVVFDASSKTPGKLSLNETLLVGPTIQSELFSILLRFRKHKIALIADIEKMFRQVRICENHCDFQRILWRNEPTDKIGVYKLCTVTYGTAPATFLTTRCLTDLANSNLNKHSLAARAIIKDMYVDDLITGCDTLEDGLELQEEISKILTSGGFNLRKWGSNCMEILKKCTSTNANDKHLIKDETDNKTLGVIWSSSDDTLRFIINASIKPTERVTKRTILAGVSKIFDPLGLVTPITTQTKVFVQQLWIMRLDWDDDLPQFIVDAWNRLKGQLLSVSEISIPRRVLVNKPVDVQLCAFCDSSEKAYAAAVYVRCVTDDGSIKISLLCSKTRVAPLKKISIPRLELCGALLLVKLVNRIKNDLDYNISKLFYFTDSTIVLNWLNGNPTRWKVFVANRVAKIQALSKITDWYHVAGRENPADIPTRINDISKLNESIWWSGPKFLYDSPETWKVDYDVDTTETKEERRQAVTLTCERTDDLLTKFSSLNKLKRVMAYVMRFKQNASQPCNVRKFGPLDSDEINKAFIKIILLAQREFSSDINELNTKGGLSTSSKLRSLSPFLDSNNILRVGGRLKNADIPYDFKHPILLPKDCPLTRLIVWQEHNRHFHAGASTTLAAIRQSFWPISGRNTVRRVLQSCIVCYKYSPKHVQLKMANLPETRTAITLPFQCTSLDFAGPFEVKETKYRGRRMLKMYVCVFVCFSTKAVHLELLSDLTCKTFLNSLKRFVARRGLPQQLYSDNARTFVAADKELKLAYRAITTFFRDDLINGFLTMHSITWKFMPPRAPHFGGLHEAAVKSFKRHFKRVTSGATLTIEEFTTLLCQIEGILNSRPLYPLSTDPNDFQPLTPGHFLIGRPINAIPEVDISDELPNRLRSYEKLKRLQQLFWKQFQRDYLTTLQQRGKWAKDTAQLDVGDIVLVRQVNSPSQHWPLGRILKFHPGSDKRRRVVTVLVQGKTYVRAATDVCPLPKQSVEMEHSKAGEYVGEREAPSV